MKTKHHNNQSLPSLSDERKCIVGETMDESARVTILSLTSKGSGYVPNEKITKYAPFGYIPTVQKAPTPIKNVR